MTTCSQKDKSVTTLTDAGQSVRYADLAESGDVLLQMLVYRRTDQLSLALFSDSVSHIF